MPSLPGLVSGCRLDYMSSAGSECNISNQLSTSIRITSVSCDNQTISYTGTAYDSMLRALGCPRSGIAKCPTMRGNSCFYKNYSDNFIQYLLGRSQSLRGNPCLHKNYSHSLFIRTESKFGV